MNTSCMYFVAAMTAVCVPASAASYEYANIFDGRHIITIQTSPPIVASNDRAVEAKFCRPPEAFYCVTSELLKFAIPVKKGERSSRWEYGGVDYFPKTKSRMFFFDKYIDVHVIESMQNNRRLRYLYSDRYGLVAFGVDIDGRTEVFLSQRRIGFAGG